ncbi:MAG: DUF5916 domain-containing protein [Flavobacteriales bacterium]
MIYKQITLALFACLFFISDSLAQRVTNAIRKTGEIVLDGKLDEAAWVNAESTSDFTQLAPNPGKPSSFKTEVRIIFDDDAIYVGARMFDTSPDSILMELSARDVIKNSDEFGIMFCPYNDGNNGVVFTTTPAGVFFDMILSSAGADSGWDAVWDVRTAVDYKGWVAEFRIPWAALRFAKMEEGEDVIWGVNIWRGIKRYREMAFWEPRDPTLQVNGVAETGEIHGFSNITPPPRLTFFPYASSYVESIENGAIGTRFNGGLDFKAGLGDAFTLDMTLIPDFGQVVTDNLVLNLSPYEIQLADNRPFFTEGTDLFKKSGLFYSRRIGEGKRLINATKLSGRTSGGLGIGALQAFALDTSDSSALTSYSVAVLDQTLPNNGYIHGVSTFVTHESDVESALVQGIDFEVRNKLNSYSVTGAASYSPGGHRLSVGLNKISGNFTMGIGRNSVSEFYDPNDLGYQQAPNKIINSIGFGYKIVEPFGRFLKLFSNGGVVHKSLYNPKSFTELNIQLECGVITNKFMFYKVGFTTSPLRGYDYFEPRIEGMSWKLPSWGDMDFIISTDYRKRLAFDLRIARSIAFTEGVEWNGVDLRLSPRFRASDKLSFKYIYSFQGKSSELGFATLQMNSLDEDVSVFGRRNNNSETHVINGTYIISNRASIDARLRHYWSTVDYLEFYSLGSDSELHSTSLIEIDNDGNSEYDVNYNAWSVDLGLTWNFPSGSELSIVWKNTLQSQGQMLPTGYFDNWEQMLEESFINSLSIKALYYLDYSNIRRQLKG